MGSRHNLTDVTLGFQAQWQDYEKRQKPDDGEQNDCRCDTH
jgi:hypothetical protein